MSKHKHLIQTLKNALEVKSGRLDELGKARAIKELEKLHHSLTVKNHKRAKKQLEQFTRQLVELLQD